MLSAHPWRRQANMEQFLKLPESFLQPLTVHKKKKKAIFGINCKGVIMPLPLFFGKQQFLLVISHCTDLSCVSIQNVN